jgi:predicted ATPase
MLAWIGRTGEAYYLAELHRQRGDLLLQADPDAEAQAEAAYRDAVAAAQAMKARMCELRALTSLCRLRSIRSNDAGRAAARAELARVYQWFTEGFDTQDLKEAREALQSLSVA